MGRKPKKIGEIIAKDESFALAEGIKAEKLSPMFFDAKKLIHQPEPIYRLDLGNYRYYYRFIDDEPVFYISVTTMTRNTLPTSPFLVKWIADTGSEQASAYVDERASYGKILHMQCGELLIIGTYDLDKLPEKLKQYSAANKITPKDDWIDELKKDILAFSQFMIDYNVKPLAIEPILYHPDDGYAGAIDIVCEKDHEEKGFFGEVYASGANKGQPKESKRKRRIIAIVDIKSGRKGFYESNEIQLQAYKTMWNLHFPDVPAERTFNWSPKAWVSTPSYNLKDQTDCVSAEKLPHLINLAKIEDRKRSNKVTIYSGVIELLKGLQKNISEITFNELVKTKK